MKNLALLFILSVVSYSCIAQRIVLSNSATIDPPKGMTKIPSKNISNTLGQKFAMTKYMSKAIKEHGDEIYTVDNMVIVVTSGRITREPGFLRRYKLALDETADFSSGYTSKIEMIAGKQVYTRQVIAESFNLYRFTAINSGEDTLVNGFIQFNESDRKRARVVLIDLIRGLKFNR
ncbi:MAG: hypothetical protein EOO43_09715 [Flavobacterium sp.]|nr:MAG: hypothetical protein EOO43_09715 [Flavobacterium sp.]